MSSMNVSLLDPMRDYVRDLIRRDQSVIVDEERWLRDLDASIEESVREMKAGGGLDLDEVCDAMIGDIRRKGGSKAPQ